MHKRRDREIKNNFFSNQYLVSAIGLIIIISIAIPLIKNLNKQHQINNEIKGLEEEISQLENKNLQLKNLTEYLGSDEFVNEQARLQLNYRAEGEEVVVIKSKEEPSAQSTDNKEKIMYNNKKKTRSNPSRWWNYFFNN